MERDRRLGLLGERIHERAQRRGLTVSLAKLLYASDLYFEHFPRPISNVLYVGVGHGHDAMLNLLTGRFQRLVGVDPFIEAHGNGDYDYQVLLQDINRLDLKHQFVVVRRTIQDFVVDCSEEFDLVVMIDVLHHMFCTPLRLRESDMYVHSVELCSLLRSVCKQYLLITDVERYGVRPFLAKRKIMKSRIDYTTKQPWKEWDLAIQTAGFRLTKKRHYVPHALRWIPSFLVSGNLTWRMLFDRYILIYHTD